MSESQKNQPDCKLSGSRRPEKLKTQEIKRCNEAYRFQDYEQMMRHDVHGRVRGRIRQQGWAKR